MDTPGQIKYERLLRDLEATLDAELNQTDAESAPVQLDGTMGRISRGDAMQAQQVALEVKRQRKERLRLVRRALRRIESGAYGTCSHCRGPISEARLEAYPEAAVCIHCASGSGG